MLDLATLLVGGATAVGFAALISTDPVVIQKAYVPTLVAYQGYDGELISKLLRERIRVIAREAGTTRGDQLSVFNADASAIDTLTERLHVDGVVDSLREFLDLHSFSIAPYLVHYPSGFTFHLENDATDGGAGQLLRSTDEFKLGLKGETAAGQLFYLSVAGGHDIPTLINALAERFIEQVDPYVLTLYYFRSDYPEGNFAKSLPLIEHTTHVLPTQSKVWPLLLWGRMHYRLGEQDAAIEKYRAALEIDPGFAIAIARWGEALIAKGEIENGLRKMTQAVALVSHDSFSETRQHRMSPLIHTLLGETLDRLGADEQARKIYIKGLTHSADNPFLKTGLGALYLSHAQYDPAIDLLQDALVAHPDPILPRKLLDQALEAKYPLELYRMLSH